MLAATYTIPLELTVDVVAPGAISGLTVIGGSSPRPRKREVMQVSPASEAIEKADEQTVKSPRWASLLRGHSQRLADLKPGWDGPGSARVSRFALYTAGRIVSRSLVDVEDAVAPYLVPGGDGSVQIEWHEKRGELELAIGPDGTFAIWGCDHLTGAAFEGEGERALALFDRWAPRLASKPHHEVHAPPQGSIPLFTFEA